MPEFYEQNTIDGLIFLKANNCMCSSYVSHSILHGRDLLIKGLRWSTGDGKSVRIFSDPWLPSK